MGDMRIGVTVPIKLKAEDADFSIVDEKTRKVSEKYPVVDSNTPYTQQSTNHLQTLTETVTDNTDSFKVNTAILKEFGNVMPDIIQSLRHMNAVVAQTTTSLPAIKKTITDEDKKRNQLSEYRRRNFFGLLDTGNGTLNSLTSGNIGGAGINLVSGAGNTVNNLSNMAKVKDMENLSKGLLATGGVIMAGAALLKGGKALADSYKEAMPTIFGTGKAFGTTDDRESMNLYKKVNTYNRDTGLDIDSWNTLIQDLRKQGVGNQYSNPTSQAMEAGQIAQTVGQWAYKTGGNANQYAQLAGMMARYGGSTNVSEDFNYLVAAGKASGLNDVQIPEFLSGIQKVMEDGIAKGFTRSSIEVAQTLTMFSKMSGSNAFWQGEQGARMLNQMNSGISGATALNSSEDILVYQAFSNAYSGTIKDKNGNEISKIEAALGKGTKDSTYIEGGGYANMMQLIEQGVNGDNFGALMQMATDAAGGDGEKETEILKNMFGLNYTGVGRLKNLDWQNMSKDELDKRIKEELKDPNNQNKETRWQQDLNNIAEALQTMGEPIFNLEVAGMDAISSDVKRIADHLYSKKETEEKAENIMDSLTDEQLSYYLSSPEMMKRAKDKKLGLQDLENLSKWNGFGRVPGIKDDAIFNDEPFSPVGLFGETWADKEGAWSLDNTIDNKNLPQFLKLGFGDEILNFYHGDTNLANLAVEALSKSSKAEDLRDDINKYSHGHYTKAEQEDTVKKILELLKSGITIYD